VPSGEPKALVPKDLRGVRKQQIGYLQDPQSFMRSVGAFNLPQTPLQMQGADAIGRMLQGVTPEQQAYNTASPWLTQALSGQGPQFEQDLSMANQQGGRFGSANALLRGEALRNLYNMRTQVSQTLGLLGQGAGQANRGLAGQAFGIGQQQAGQADIETQRRLQILLQLLGSGQQSAFNVPIQSGGGIGSFLGGLAGLGLGGFGGQLASSLFGGGIPQAPNTSGFDPVGLPNIPAWNPGQPGQ
jgi:hypothetical protein